MSTARKHAAARKPAAKKSAAKKSAAKEAPVKGAEEKRTAARKPNAKKPAKANGKGADTGPFEGDIKKGELRYKLKALHLEFEREDVRVRTSIQGKLNELVARAQRNDPGWKRAAEVRKAAVNEAIDLLTKTLPDGYAITNIDLVGGTYRAIYDPEARGQHVE